MMVMKTCNKCLEEKEETEFRKYRNTCKKCLAIELKVWRANNKEHIQLYSKEYKEKHREHLKEKKKLWNKNNEEKKKEYRKKDYEKHSKRYKERAKVWREEYRERAYQNRKTWFENNPEKIRESKIKYKKKKYKNDLRYRLNVIISDRIRSEIRDKNGISWKNILDFTLEQLLNHLEFLFQEGMSFENYGKWEVDHIIPVTAYNFSSYKDNDFKKCWSLDNLRPSWKRDNISKLNKIDWSIIKQVPGWWTILPDNLCRRNFEKVYQM